MWALIFPAAGQQARSEAEDDHFWPLGIIQHGPARSNHHRGVRLPGTPPQASGKTKGVPKDITRGGVNKIQMKGCKTITQRDVKKITRRGVKKITQLDVKNIHTTGCEKIFTRLDVKNIHTI